MLGAIIGDIVGSRFEFNPTNDYDFELFTNQCDYTDDSICTIAIADALLKGKDFGESLHEWCNRTHTPKVATEDDSPNGFTATTPSPTARMATAALCVSVR
jgi:ADP-ribosylglycohydrolase